MHLAEGHGDSAGIVRRTFPARRRHGHPARWIAKLPKPRGKANQIYIDVRYKHHIGAASYAAGLRVR